MAEYIEKKKLVNSLKMWLMDLENDMDKGDYGELSENKGAREAVECCIAEIETLPVTDVQPVKRGRWIKCDYKRLDDAREVQTYIGQGVYCSKCRTGFHKNEVKNWIGCPCCLTRMDGDIE